MALFIIGTDNSLVAIREQSAISTFHERIQKILLDTKWRIFASTDWVIIIKSNKLN